MADIPNISVIGAGQCDSGTARRAERLGALIAGQGYALVCGGLAGVMAAAAKGARRAGGPTLGILPGMDRADANEHVQTAVATGLGQMRNFLVVANADVVIAVEGGYGTLSELALALKIGKPVVAMGTWSEIPGVVPVAGPEEALEAARAIVDGSA